MCLCYIAWFVKLALYQSRACSGVLLIFIPTLKKPKTTRCQEYTTTSNAATETCNGSPEREEAEFDDAQSGFRQRKLTRKWLLNLRLIDM